MREQSSADPNQPNRGVLYAVGLVAALVLVGGNGIFYKLEPMSYVAPDQMREAAEIPGAADKKTALPPTFGTSGGLRQ